MTVLEVLNGATDYLGRQGVESPRLNAEYLLAHVLGKKKRIELYLDFERPLGEKERAPLRELVRERANGRPLQHLLGTVEFCGREFVCDGRALIPRPETEQLVEMVLGRIEENAAVLDVGTGSGVIAITIALQKPTAAVTAVDVSTDALALARENATRLGARVGFLESDLLAAVPGPWNAMVANLPYVAAADMEELSREVRHDPRLALDGGEDGLDLVRRLVVDAKNSLAPGGLVALEIGHDQAARVRALFEANNYRDIAVSADYQGVERFVFAVHG
ncbi:MAG: peptide chain release factor N(5)-glutamine methyltransferase [Terrimicrobiaceae bacterium]|nr:peptide chain release factor N(5)-glutamine methyltransferase [Terrimicrobiaceae bacterium]